MEINNHISETRYYDIGIRFSNNMTSRLMMLKIVIVTTDITWLTLSDKTACHTTMLL